jgi:5-methylcytosine-specific restriction enzyme A
MLIDIYNQDQVGRWIQSLIDSNKLHDFYVSGYWLRLRAEVLQEYKHECQQCKEKGYYKRADTVHHVQYVRKHPRWALSKTYVFEGKERRNLFPLCHACHEIVHGYRKKKKEKPLTEERW